MRKSEIYIVRVCPRIVCLILFSLFIRQLPDFRTASIAVFGLFIPWILLVARQGKGGQKAIRWQKVRASGVDPLSGMGTADMHMGRLVTASATTGWFDWIHGEVWIFPHGFLRIRSGLGQTLMNGFGPTVDRQQMNIQWFSHEQFDQLRAKRSNRWTPREQIVKAYLHHGASTDRLLLVLADGRSEKLLWFPIDNAFPVFQMVLMGWLGKRLLVD
jgi:hypothetical protein